MPVAGWVTFAWEMPLERAASTVPSATTRAYATAVPFAPVAPVRPLAPLRPRAPLRPLSDLIVPLLSFFEVIVRFFSFLPEIVPFLMLLPLILLAAYADPPSATQSASSATIMAGEGSLGFNLTDARVAHSHRPRN